MTLTPAPVLDTSVLTPFDRLSADVELAEGKAVTTFVDYHNPAINKVARSYIYGLRQIRAAIDRQRKAHNDEAQAYIRRVNGFAKELTERVTALIEPHERILKGIEEAERDRIAQHEAGIDTIIQMGRCTIRKSAQIQEYLDTLAAFNPEGFEEFTPRAAAEIEIARRALEEVLQMAIDHEEAEAARERERKEEEAAERQRRDEEIAAKAREEGRREAKEEAREAEQEAVRSGTQQTACPSPDRERILRHQLAHRIENILEAASSMTVAKRLLSNQLHPAITITVDWNMVKS